MASKKTNPKLNSVRSGLSDTERELFDLLVAHYVRSEMQRKRIVGDYHRQGMDPARATSVVLAAINYLSGSPRRENDPRFPRQISLRTAPGGAVVQIHANRTVCGDAYQLQWGPSCDPLPDGNWEIVAIEVLEEPCPTTRRGSRG